MFISPQKINEWRKNLLSWWEQNFGQINSNNYIDFLPIIWVSKYTMDLKVTTFNFRQKQSSLLLLWKWVIICLFNGIIICQTANLIQFTQKYTLTITTIVITLSTHEEHFCGLLPFFYIVVTLRFIQWVLLQAQKKWNSFFKSKMQ